MNKFNSLQMEDIQKAYTKIDYQWLILHYKISIIMIIFAFFIECILSIVVLNSSMLTTTVPKYILKFIIAPSGSNIICILIDTAAIHSKKLTQKSKIYIVSIIYVMMCFILFTVHSAFTATYYIFISAIMLTTLYADKTVTFVTGLLSMVLLIVSELFISWDVDKISIFEDTLRLSNFLLSLFIMIGVSVICMFEIRYERRKNAVSIQMEKDRQSLQQSLITDEQTGLFNRKALHNAMQDLEDRTPGDHYILGIGDLDHFKQINDCWGHQIGDECLVAFSQLLAENCANAAPFRYGGDEFCLLFHNITIEDAVRTCRNIQAQLKKIKLEQVPALCMTSSFGLAKYDQKWNAVQLFVNADQALYKAKVERDQVCVFE